MFLEASLIVPFLLGSFLLLDLRRGTSNSVVSSVTPSTFRRSAFRLWIRARPSGEKSSISGLKTRTSASSRLYFSAT